MKTATEIPFASGGHQYRGTARAWRLDPPLVSDPWAPLSTLVPDPFSALLIGAPMGEDPGPELREITTVTLDGRTIGIPGAGGDATLYDAAGSMYDRALKNNTKVNVTKRGPIADPNPLTDGSLGDAAQYLETLGYTIVAGAVLS